MNENRRAVIYARVATEEALNDGKVSTQVEACRQYADQHELTIAEDQITTIEG